MARDIEVNYEVLEDVSQSFQASSQKTDEMIRRIVRQMQQLEAGWKGSGAQAFFREMEDEVLPTAGRLIDALEQASQATLQISSAFADAEDNASSVFKQSSPNGKASTGGKNGYQKGLEGIGQLLLEKGFDKVVDEFVKKYGKNIGDLIAKSDGLEKVLGPLAKSPFLKKYGGEFLGAGFGGLVDWGMGDVHTLEELGVQVGSDLIQTIPHVKVASWISAANQIIGNFESEFYMQNADFLGGGNPDLADFIRSHAQSYQDSLGKMDLDARIDGIVRSATSPGFAPFNVVGGIVSESWTFVSGTAEVVWHQTALKGGNIIGGVINAGKALQVAGQVIEGTGEVISNTANDFANFVTGLFSN